MSSWCVSLRAEATGLEVDIYDVIDPRMGVSLADIKDALKGDPKKVLVRINSAGGDAVEGLAIYNLLKDSGAKVTVKIDGLAASIASIIAMAGDEIVMSESAFMMIHKPFGVTEGRSDDLRKMADLLDKICKQMVGIYKTHTSQSDDEIMSALEDETWMTAEEAVQLGYATRVVPTSPVKAEWNLGVYAKVPEGVLRMFDAVPSDPPNSKPVEEGGWDADAAIGRWRKYASSDGSGDPEKMNWAKYATAFAWYDASNKEAFGSYKLPHHDVKDGKPVTVKAGVIAAGNAVQGSRGGVNLPSADVPKVKAHLARHYRQFDMTPPWESKDSQMNDTTETTMQAEGDDKFLKALNELSDKLDKHMKDYEEFKAKFSKKEDEDEDEAEDKKAKAEDEDEDMKAKADDDKDGDDDHDDDDDDKDGDKKMKAQASAMAIVALKARVAELETDKRTVQVSEAIKAGKLRPSQKAWALGLSQKVFNEYLATLGEATVGPVGKEHTPDPTVSTDTANVELTREEKIAAEAFGRTHAQALADKRAKLGLPAAQRTPLTLTASDDDK